MKQKDIESIEIYKRIEGDFYEKQMKSLNPLRKWFHTNRYRIINSLVKGKYRNGMRIVDFGCGSCSWNMDHLNVFGIDINEALLKLGKEKGMMQDYKVADAHDTGLSSESVDLVVAFEFLEHLVDYEQVIQEMYRILKKGRFAIISVPYDTWLSLWKHLFLIQVVLHGYILGDEYYRRRCGHVQHFSPDTIKDAFVKSGFNIELLFDMRRMTIFLIAQKDGSQPHPIFCPDTTIILPTLNEGKFIKRMLEYLTTYYQGARIIITDDGSSDGSREIASGFRNKNVFFLDRTNEKVHGLTASVLDAIKYVNTKYFVVIDADGQHPPQKVEEMINLLRLGSKVVVGSRIEVKEGWAWNRKVLSYIGTALGKLSLLARNKYFISYDILSGFFGIRTRFFNAITTGKIYSRHFKLRGFKILFDTLKLLPRRQEIEEVYYKFETRQGGNSKLQMKVNFEYLKAIFS